MSEIRTDLTNAAYHALPGLSSTGAKTLATCPAQYRWATDHPVHRDVFDYGTVMHELILGKGDGYAVIDADDWRTKTARDDRDSARAAGLTPILRADHQRADAIATATLQHPDVAPLFASGAAELSVLADADGIPVRCRPDWLTETRDGRPVCVDVKTTAGQTHPSDLLGRYGVIARLGYHQSAAWYVDTLALAGVADALFLLLFVPKDGPMEPRVVTLDDDSLAVGRALNRQALDTFAECTESGEWPCKHPVFITGSIYEREAI